MVGAYVRRPPDAGYRTLPGVPPGSRSTLDPASCRSQTQPGGLTYAKPRMAEATDQDVCSCEERHSLRDPLPVQPRRCECGETEDDALPGLPYPRTENRSQCDRSLSERLHLPRGNLSSK